MAKTIFFKTGNGKIVYKAVYENKGIRKVSRVDGKYHLSNCLHREEYYPFGNDDDDEEILINYLSEVCNRDFVFANAIDIARAKLNE